MPHEATLDPTANGLVPRGDGWFVLNARGARWWHADGRTAVCGIEGDVDFPELGLNVSVLEPGELLAMYNWEADQEDFLVLAGEGLLLVEGQERRLRRWDFVHCPPDTKHIIVGAGEGPCVVLALGARQNQEGPGWGGYTVDDVARSHGAGVDAATNDPNEAYARFEEPFPVAYGGWLPI